jgi:hypothetical protein
MQTFLVSDDYNYCAKTLDGNRLNSQLNEALVIIRSLFRVYEPNPRTGRSGWEGHTVAEMWRGHELQLAKYAEACALEFYKNRPLPKTDQVTSFEKRRARYHLWRDMIVELEEQGAPDTKPILMGDEEFHSAFRALLLYKECQAITFKKWKKGDYPDHASTRVLLPQKRAWKREHYEAIWAAFGRPDPIWYAQWEWGEEPNDMRVFYNEDRVPQMLREKKRKIEKPYAPFYDKARQESGQDSNPSANAGSP